MYRIAGIHVTLMSINKAIWMLTAISAYTSIIILLENSSIDEFSSKIIIHQIATCKLKPCQNFPAV